MTLFYYIGSSSDLGAQAVRLGSGFSFTEAAESGELAMSQVRVDDPSGTLNIPGHYPFRAIETGCSFDSLFRGYFADRTIKRADSYLTGAARVWDATVYDVNSALQFEIIRGTGAKRPAETDTARLAWMLGSGFTGPISTDGSAVFGAGVDLDKQDYRGMTMADVLSDAAQVSGCNYFVTWDAPIGAPVLHYYLPTRAFNSSTLRISNVLADVDGTTVFAPSMDSELSRDPSRVFSGVYFNYGDSMSAAVYETNATVLAAIGRKRETQVLDSSVGSASRASAKANKYLNEAETEQDTIMCTLHKVPVAQVNLIRAGHRIQVKFTHLPGYSAYTWMRVTRRTVRQDGDTQLYYSLLLTLVLPKQGGSSVRHRPGRRPDAETGTGGALTLALREARNRFDDYATDPVAEIDYHNPTIKSIGSLVFNNVAYTLCGCPLGFGGWSGLAEYEAWWEYTTGALADNVIGIRFTVAAADPTYDWGRTDQAYYYGFRTSAPTDVGQYEALGGIQWISAGATVDIPRSAINEGGTSYFCIAPGWHAGTGLFFCAQDLVAGLYGPAGDVTSGGEGNSGRVRAPVVTAVYLTAGSTSGFAPWVAAHGAINGSNRVFTPYAWDLTGRPGVALNGVILGASDYEVDDVAGTVTLRLAPQIGDQVTFRYQMGA